MSNQKAAVDSGQWLLYRYNPERTAQGENPLIPVSYTHLDVYKRQPVDLEGWDYDRDLNDPGHFPYTRGVQATMSVSYTHLDVYKRQDMH